MDFGSTYTSDKVANVGKCSICKQDVKRGENMDVERMTIHKSCFKCAWCDSEVQIGRCSRDRSLESKFGIRYFCRDHMLKAPVEKAAAMTEKGITKPK